MLIRIPLKFEYHVMLPNPKVQFQVSIAGRPQFESGKGLYKDMDIKSDFYCKKGLHDLFNLTSHHLRHCSCPGLIGG